MPSQHSTNNKELYVFEFPISGHGVVSIMADSLDEAVEHIEKGLNADIDLEYDLVEWDLNIDREDIHKCWANKGDFKNEK
jgi:hypothetical protein